MLKAVFELFRQEKSGESNPHTVELATAALLSEIIRADNNTDQRELEAYKSLLASHFSLSDSALSVLVKAGQDTAEDAVDLAQFTQAINQQCNNEEKQAILKGLWEVAYADKQIAPLEEHIIRRIADLLYLSHSQFIKAKLSVTQ